MFRVLSVGEYRSPESPEEEEAPCARQSGGPDEDLYGPDVHHRQSNGGSHTRKEPRETVFLNCFVTLLPSFGLFKACHCQV